MRFKFNTSKHPIILLAIIGSVIMLFKIVEQLDFGYDKRQIKADARAADFIVEGAVYQEFTVQGQLANQFEAKTLHYFGQTKQGAVTNPVIDIHAQEPKNSSWHITANEGKIDGVSRLAQLNGNVIMNRLQSATEEPLTLKTSTLDIDTNNKTIHNNAPVALTSPEGSINGVGIEGSLIDGQYKILNKVHMIIQPQTSNDSPSSPPINKKTNSTTEIGIE